MEIASSTTLSGRHIHCLNCLVDTVLVNYNYYLFARSVYTVRRKNPFEDKEKGSNFKFLSRTRWVSSIHILAMNRTYMHVGHGLWKNLGEPYQLCYRILHSLLLFRHLGEGRLGWSQGGNYIKESFPQSVSMGAVVQGIGDDHV